MSIYGWPGPCYILCTVHNWGPLYQGCLCSNINYKQIRPPYITCEHTWMARKDCSKEGSWWWPDSFLWQSGELLLCTCVSATQMSPAVGLDAVAVGGLRWGHEVYQHWSHYIPDLSSWIRWWPAERRCLQILSRSDRASFDKCVAVLVSKYMLGWSMVYFGLRACAAFWSWAAIPFQARMHVCVCVCACLCVCVCVFVCVCVALPVYARVHYSVVTMPGQH